MKTFIQTSKVLILSIAVLTVLGYAQAAWEAPAGEPSASNNAPAPINVSSSNQDKLGGFAAASLVADTITSPKFCIPGQGCITGWGSEGGGTNVVNNYERGSWCGFYSNQTSGYGGMVPCLYEGVEYNPGTSCPSGFEQVNFGGRYTGHDNRYRFSQACVKL